MGANLWELWIIDKSGLALVHVRNKDVGEIQSISPILFSGVLSAVEVMAEKTLDAIKMKDSKIIVVPISDPVPITFVGRASIKTKDKSIRKRSQSFRLFWYS